jgi:hypothetical protein
MDFRLLYSIGSLLPLLLPTTTCCLSLPFPNDERFITLFPRVTE